jgi:two-component system, NtrC family, nitrogen regulation sensor histidine kinase NtrY
MTRSYKANLVIRMTLLSATAIGTGIAIAGREPLHINITLATALVIIAANLYWYINRVNRKITYFFESVKNRDHSLSFPTHGEDKTLARLGSNLERINELIQEIHIENRRQEQYFGALIEHVGTGIMSYDNEGFVIHANGSLRKLLGMKQFTHLRQLERVDPILAGSISMIGKNDEKLITFKGPDGIITLLVKSGTFKSRGETLTLVSMQDIRRELDEKELDSWLKLIRVLTHEIMNSIAPVTSLSENLCNSYIREGRNISAADVNDKLVDMTIRGLTVIREQGQGLARFVESYRELTRLPRPVRSEVVVKDLFEKTALLCAPYFENGGITISHRLEEPGIRAFLDENQISQVLVNLLKNAAEALGSSSTGGGSITMECRRNSGGQIEISVIDNGPGIPPEQMENIFVPFFTTRENGSGIGLSISRQIMRLHKGSLRVVSFPGRETRFTMTFGR